MLISPELAKAFNKQIGNEFGASMQYLSIASYFYAKHLTLLAFYTSEPGQRELGIEVIPGAYAGCPHSGS